MPDPQQTTPQNPPADDTSAAPTREEFQKFASLTNALGAKLREDREGFAKKLTQIEETIKSLAEKGPAKADSASEPDASKPDPRVAAAEARIKEMEQRLEVERKQREEVEEARKAQERRTALSNALTARGVQGPLLKAAMATLYDAEGRVTHDDKGNLGMRFTRKTTAGDYDEFVPIDQGLDELFKQEDYRIFLPPRPAQGSGTVPGRAMGTKPTKEQEKAAALAQLLPAMLGRG